MIDLKKLRPVVTGFIQDSLDEFSREHPETRISCLGLFGEGYYGAVDVFVDTAAHARKRLNEYDNMLARQKEDKATLDLMGHTGFQHWIQNMEACGRDSLGRFNTCCNDFAYCAGKLQLPDWPDPHSETEDDLGRWDFQWPDGRITRVDTSEGDVGIDCELFEFLLGCLESLDISRLNTETVFRVGLEMDEGTYVKFWVSKTMQPNGYKPYEYRHKQRGV